MKMLDVFRSILSETLTADMEAEDVLMRAVGLHTHSIVLRPGLDLEDVLEAARNDGRLVLAPLTRRHVATLIAECWPDSATTFPRHHPTRASRCAATRFLGWLRGLDDADRALA